MKERSQGGVRGESRRWGESSSAGGERNSTRQEHANQEALRGQGGGG
jgi:hypothetical protein